MYTDGFGVAVVVGVVAFLLPAAWIGWWLIADLGEKVSGKAAYRAAKSSSRRFHPAA